MTREVVSWSAAKSAGLKRYFTGKACPRGHVVERFVGRRQCTACNGTHSRKWNKSQSPEYRRAAKLKANYGLTLADFDEMFVGQGRRCKCCGSTEPKSKKGWQVDHCHNSGRLRGILCMRCNCGLGYAGDSIEPLQAMIEYLRQSMQ